MSSVDDDAGEWADHEAAGEVDELLSRPTRRLPIGLNLDADAFGRFSESIARFFGTGRYLAIQTVVVILWLAINAAAIGFRWDPYPFILLNLVFSTQAAYAAPLILLAQNRQDTRDRVQAERDRATTERILTDTEYLARELAAVRLALEDVASTTALDELVERLESAGLLDTGSEADSDDDTG